MHFVFVKGRVCQGKDKNGGSAGLFRDAGFVTVSDGIFGKLILEWRETGCDIPMIA